MKHPSLSQYLIPPLPVLSVCPCFCCLPYKRYFMEFTVFWDVVHCSVVGRYQCFGRTCCLHLQGGKVTQALPQYWYSLPNYPALHSHCIVQQDTVQVSNSWCNTTPTSPKICKRPHVMAPEHKTAALSFNLHPQ